MNGFLRIAIADDDAIMRQFVARAVRRLGHQVVVTANDGRELVERCIANVVDVIITDLSMPEIDGIDAASQLNADGATPVILITGEDVSTFLERAGMQFVTTHLRKPIKTTDLENAITIATRQSRAT